MEIIHGLWTAPPGQIRFNFMLLAIGAALYFGSATVIAVIRWLALLAVIPAIAGPVQQILMSPLELAIVQLRLYPGQVILYHLPLVFTAAVATLVALRLNTAPVRAALRTHGKKPGGPLVPAILGLLLLICSTIFMRHMLEGPDAVQAAEMVANRFGSKYKYFTNGLNIVTDNQGTTVYATVQMWNEKEALQVPVQWRR